MGNVIKQLHGKYVLDVAALLRTKLPASVALEAVRTIPLEWGDETDHGVLLQARVNVAGRDVTLSVRVTGELPHDVEESVAGLLRHLREIA